MTVVQEQIPNKLIQAAEQLSENQLTTWLNGTVIFGDIYFRSLKVALKAIGQILRRPVISKDIYGSAKKIFTPIGAGRTEQYMTNLNNPLWIPQENEVVNLTKNIAKHMLDPMLNFGSTMIREIIASVLDFIKKQVASFLVQIQGLVKGMRDDLINLSNNISLQTLVGLFVNEAKRLLNQDPVYRSSPRKVKDMLVGKLEGNIRTALNRIRSSLESNNLSEINRALGSWKLDAKILLDSFKEHNLTQFYN
ncbi:hypothetical protein SAMN03159341_12446 [Paenibacillus sp. 1_12]|nr:hypothetical protein SAMN03159341_12446 [Paenibacillus sp. 1_12]